MRQKFFALPFGTAGDRSTIPNAQQTDGSVSYAQGFGPDYEADPAVSPTAKPVPREGTNGLYYDVTDALRALQTDGAPEFITSANNGGSPFSYSRGATVRWSSNGQPPFTTYVSRVNGNTTTPSNATNWTPLIFEAATNAQALAGSSSGLIVTPAALAFVLSQTSVSVPSATTTEAGTTRYATNAEANAGTPANAAITPPALQSALAAYNIPASQVASGTFNSARIPSLDASKVTSGTFGVGRIPSLEALGAPGLTAENRFTRTNTYTLRLAAPGVQAPDGSRLDLVGGTGGGVRILVNGFITTGATEWDTAGNMTVSGSVTANGGFQGSSRTVKRDIRTTPGAEALALVEAVESVSYEYRREYRDDGGRRSFGFIAEDLVELIPEVVRATPDGPSPLVVEHAQLTAILWAAVQHQARQIRELQERLDD